MKMNKDKLKKIFEVALLLAFVFSIGTDKFPFVTNAIVVLWLVLILIDVVDNILYRAGFKKSEIRYATVNDGAGKYSQFGIGAFILLLSVGVYFCIPSTGIYPLAGIGIGFLLVVMGLLDLPKGIMKLKANQLSLTGVKEKIEKGALKVVEIEQDSITLIDNQNRVVRQESLDLSPSTANVIEQFLHTHIGSEDIVKNKVR